MKQLKQKWGQFITNPALVFLSLATVTGVLSTFLTPQLVVSDENMHFLRAYNLASGDLGNKDCSYPKDIIEKAAAVYEGDLSAGYSKKVDFSQVTNATCGTAAAYSPFMHIPQAIGIAIAKLIYPSTGLMVLLGRLANVTLYVAALYFIIKKIRFGKWVLVVMGLFPSMIHLAASLSSDVVNNIVVLGAIAFMFNLFCQKTPLLKKQIISLVVVACALALTKLTNLILLLPLVFLPTRLFKPNTTTARFNLQKWSLILIALVLCILSTFAWQKIYGASLVTAAPVANPLSEHPHHFIKVVFNTYINPFIEYGDKVLRGIVGEFASFSFRLPSFVIFMELLLFVFVLLHKNKQEETELKSSSRWLTWSSLGALGLTVLSVTYALFTIWSIQSFSLGPTATYADGVQGRYFIASLALLIPAGVWLRKFIVIDTKSKQSLGAIVFFVSSFSLLFYLIETYRFFK
jgi:uncharacterized membrane protein